MLKGCAHKISSVITTFVKDAISLALGQHGLNGGIKFDLTDDDFEKQDSVNYLPSSLISSLEFAINISTSHLSDNCKDMIVACITDGCCEKLESFINQVVVYII